jgi:hydrogenase maturation protease
VNNPHVTDPPPTSAATTPLPYPWARRLVIGIGNPDRGDDAVGRLVARALRIRAPLDVRIEECQGEATELLHLLHQADCAWLIDAAQSSDAPAGTVRRLNVADRDLAHFSATTSSHGLGLIEAIGLARTLGYLPRHCVIYAIAGSSFSVGAPPGDTVTSAVAQVATAILAELAQQDSPFHA